MDLVGRIEAIIELASEDHSGNVANARRLARAAIADEIGKEA